MKITSWLLGAFLLPLLFSGCSTMIKAARNRPKILNSTDTFLRFWDESAGLTIDQKVTNFKLIVLPASPAFYKFKFEKWRMQGKDPDLELRRELEEFKSIESSFREESRTFSAELDKNIRSFLETFPDFHADFTINVVHSLGEMDGGAREIAGKTEIIFGIDGMVRFHNGTTNTPFFHHELFHFYHAQQSDLMDFEQLYQAFWVEGLATYVSEKLNPESTIRDLMLDTPSGMVEETKKKLRMLLGIVEKNLENKFESGNDPDYVSFFLLSSQNATVPKRSGYYLGYLIAAEIGKDRSIVELAKLNQQDVLPLMKNAISRLLARDQAVGEH